MNKTSIATLVVTILGGIGVIASYIWVFSKNKGNYVTHEYWYGLDESVVKLLIFFQVLAAIGFLMAILTWIIAPPVGGVLDPWYALPTTLLFFFITAIIWPFATHFEIEWLVVLSLIGTAICTIVLLAGSVEENNPRWWVVLGLMLLSIVTVLSDAIIWNANYIRNVILKK
jgi:hypothetical protein